MKMNNRKTQQMTAARVGDGFVEVLPLIGV